MRRALLPFLALAAGSANAADCKNAPLMSPAECCTFTSPASFSATFLLTTGNVTINAQRKWSPIGVDRLFSMIKCNFFGGGAEGEKGANDDGLFRVVPGFVVQFGIPGVPAISAVWENLVIANDPVILSNTRGTISYAAEQDASGQAFNRTTQ